VRKVAVTTTKKSQVAENTINTPVLTACFIVSTAYGLLCVRTEFYGISKGFQQLTQQNQNLLIFGPKPYGFQLHRIVRHPTAPPFQIACFMPPIDFLLSKTRDLGAARRFFQKALAAPGHPRPRVITADGNPPYPAVVQELKRAGALGRHCRFRTVPYLIAPSSDGINAKPSFRFLDGAWCTIQGYEAMHMIGRDK
jgi:hypothetical protein